MSRTNKILCEQHYILAKEAVDNWNGRDTAELILSIIKNTGENIGVIISEVTYKHRCENLKELSKECDYE